MKTSFFIIFSAIFCSALMQAQVSQDKIGTSTTFGVKAGLNMSNVYDIEGENFVASSSYGFAGGGFVTVPLNEYFAIQPEVLFSQKGFKASGTMLGSNYTYEKTTNFLDIPLLAVFRPIKFVSVVFGPHFSFLMSEKNTFNSALINTVQQQQFNNDSVRQNIFGLTGGADFNITDSALIGLRAGFDLQKNNSDGTSSAPRYRNVWYQLTAGYRF
ncbi:MAG: PorT family protein [Flavobacterium sp.]|nr:PorT family protein [Flavobacterium sp.]